jgi:DNA-binding NtrC family response regulator
MDEIRILFVDDESVVRELFKAKMETWEKVLAFSAPVTFQVKSGIGDVREEDLAWCDILVVDYFLGETKRAMEYVTRLDFSRQICLVVSQRSVAVNEFYRHPLALAHPGRLLMVPKTGNSWFDEVLLPCISSFCGTVEKAKAAWESQRERDYLERHWRGAAGIAGSDGPSTYGDCVGESSAMRRVFAEASGVSDLPLPILLLGEAGTGKTYLAKAIHQDSPRGGAPFVRIHCANQQVVTVEVELFGCIEMYPGFHNPKAVPGKIELADGGTVLLDEIGRMALECQDKLLGVLDSYEPGAGYEVCRLGEEKPRRVDVRFIAATDVDLKEAVENGSFLRPLLRRVDVLDVRLPPLRDRPEDIPQLVDTFVRKWAHNLDREPVNLTGDAILALQRYDWPQNVGELETWVQRLLAHHPGEEVGSRHKAIRELGNAPPCVMARDPRSLWRRILSGEVSMPLKVLAAEYGEGVAIDVAKEAIAHFNGRFPPDRQCRRLFGGMTKRAFQMWLYRKEHTLKSLVNES